MEPAALSLMHGGPRGPGRAASIHVPLLPLKRRSPEEDFHAPGPACAFVVVLCHRVEGMPIRDGPIGGWMAGGVPSANVAVIW